MLCIFTGGSTKQMEEKKQQDLGDGDGMPIVQEMLFTLHNLISSFLVFLSDSPA